MTMLRLERKRTERSNRRFVLMLLEGCALLKAGEEQDTFHKVVAALSHSTRETDIKGWYKNHAVIGMIFTEVGEAEGKSIAKALLNKVTNALCATLGVEQINEIKLSFHVFPEHSNEHGSSGPTDSTLYPDLVQSSDPKQIARLVKRAMDIAGSLFALVLAMPFLIVISAIIKLTSKGPVLFRQVRIGPVRPKIHVPEVPVHVFCERSHSSQGIREAPDRGDEGPGPRVRRQTRGFQVDERPENHPIR